MKIKSLALAVALLAVSVTSALPAQAVMVSGWDFSQYFGPGELSVDGATYTNVLSANYSNFDPTFGAGLESANFGTLFFNGQFGSSNIADPSAFDAALTPTSLSLVSNINAPVPPQGEGLNPFDSLEILTDEGQVFANELSLLARSAVDFVFAAYLDTVPGLGSDWSVSFGGQTSSGTSVVLIDFSTDGSNYTNIGSRTLTSVDTQFVLNLGIGPSERGFVRFSVDPTGADTRFDNVAINANVVVPEPGSAVLLGAALAAAAALRRRNA